jgi:hypothetical protein
MNNIGLHSAHGLNAQHGGPLLRPDQNGFVGHLGCPRPRPPPAWLAHASAARVAPPGAVTALRAATATWLVAASCNTLFSQKE